MANERDLARDDDAMTSEAPVREADAPEDAEGLPDDVRDGDIEQAGG